MPTTDPRHRLDPRDVRELVAEACFPPVPAGTPDQVGLEVEVIAVGASGVTTRRLTLDEVLARVDALVTEPGGRVGPADRRPDGTTRYALPGEGWLTFEPGGQLEVSAGCQATAAEALDDVDRTLDALAGGFDAAGVSLASVGVDVWHPAAAVPQQLTAPRYPAMASYLARRGPWGAVMMRSSASLQINLDPGGGDVAEERWTVATLVAPLAVATFACGPEEPGAARVASRRAQAWRHLDPTRSGIPPGFRGGVAGPVSVMTAAALDADVLLVRHGDGARPGRPGWSFLRWMVGGDPDLGWPTVDDLRYHLTTLFHEVRPRGPLEIRSVDALPARWRAVPVTLYAGLLYDDRARQQVLDVLAPHRRQLDELLARATVTGLADPQLCALAVEAWSYALEGARRLPAGSVRPRDLRACERYIDRFTTRGRAPTDELRQLLARDPLEALAWAAEPLPTTAGVR